MKSHNRLWVIVLTFVLAVGMTTTSSFAATAKVKSVHLNKKSITLAVGKTFQVKAKVAPKGAKVTYKSSNKKIATVTKKGLIKAKYPGKVKITVKAGKKKVVCKVTVVKGAQKTPKAPTLDLKKGVTEDTINLKAMGSKYQYRIDEDGAWGDWQKSPTFGDLDAGTKYTCQQRLAPTAKYKASAASGVLFTMTADSSTTQFAQQLQAMGAPASVATVGEGEDAYDVVLLWANWTLPKDLTIPADETLAVANGNTLTLSGAGTLTNQGYLWIMTTGNSGGIAGTQYVENNGTVIPDGRASFTWALANSMNIDIQRDDDTGIALNANAAIKDGQTVTVDGYLDLASSVLTIAANGTLTNNGAVNGDNTNTTVQIVKADPDTSILDGDGDWYFCSQGNIQFIWDSGFSTVIVSDTIFTIPNGTTFTVPVNKTLITDADSAETSIIAFGNASSSLATAQATAAGDVNGKIVNGGIIFLANTGNELSDTTIADLTETQTLDDGTIANGYVLTNSAAVVPWFEQSGLTNVGITGSWTNSSNNGVQNAGTTVTLNSNTTIPAGQTFILFGAATGSAAVSLNAGAQKLDVNGTLAVIGGTNPSRAANVTDGLLHVGAAGSVTTDNSNGGTPSISKTTSFAGDPGATFYAVTAAACAQEIFYPAAGGTAAAAVADTTYVWDANAGGTGVAGWLAQ